MINDVNATTGIGQPTQFGIEESQKLEIFDSAEKAHNLVQPFEGPDLSQQKPSITQNASGEPRIFTIESNESINDEIKYEKLPSSPSISLSSSLGEYTEEVKELEKEVKADVKELKQEVKEEVKELKQEVKADVKELKQEVKEEVKELEQEVKELKQEVSEIKEEVKHILATKAKSSSSSSSSEEQTTTKVVKQEPKAKLSSSSSSSEEQTTTKEVKQEPKDKSSSSSFSSSSSEEQPAQQTPESLALDSLNNLNLDELTQILLEPKQQKTIEELLAGPNENKDERPEGNFIKLPSRESGINTNNQSRQVFDALLHNAMHMDTALNTVTTVLSSQLSGQSIIQGTYQGTPLPQRKSKLLDSYEKSTKRLINDEMTNAEIVSNLRSQENKDCCHNKVDQGVKAMRNDFILDLNATNFVMPKANVPIVMTSNLPNVPLVPIVSNKPNVSNVLKSQVGVGGNNPPANKKSVIGIVTSVALIIFGVLSEIMAGVAFATGTVIIASALWTVLLSAGVGLLAVTGGGRLLHESAFRK